MNHANFAFCRLKILKILNFFVLLQPITQTRRESAANRLKMGNNQIL